MSKQWDLEKSKRHIKVNGKQRIMMPMRREYIKFNHYKRKLKSTFIIHTDSESILVPEDNVKKSPIEYYTKKHPNQIACIYELMITLLSLSRHI